MKGSLVRWCLGGSRWVGRPLALAVEKLFVSRLVALGVMALVLVAAGGCGSQRSSRASVSVGMRFDPAPRSVRSQCAVAARIVRYAVPCPMKVSHGLILDYVVGPTGCKVGFMTAAGVGHGCSKLWRGWVVGSSMTAGEHLVLAASPRPVSDARLVNGPGTRARVSGSWGMFALL